MHGTFLLGSFSLVKTLAKIDPVLLERIFSRLGADTLSIQWNRIDIARIVHVFDFYNALESDIQYEAETILQEIHLLANDAGIERLDRMAPVQNNDDRSNASHYSRAALAWLTCPDVFYKAVEVQKLASQKWWRSRKNLVATTPQYEPEVQTRFERAVQRLYDSKPGSARICKSEMKEYGDGIYYVILKTNDNGPIPRCGHSPRIFETRFWDSYSVVFAYDSLAATLRISSSGTSRHKMKLEELFIVTVLGYFSRRGDRVLCYLSAIKRLAFTHEFHPDDSLKITIAEIIFWACQ